MIDIEIIRVIQSANPFTCRTFPFGKSMEPCTFKPNVCSYLINRLFFLDFVNELKSRTFFLLIMSKPTHSIICKMIIGI